MSGKYYSQGDLEDILWLNVLEIGEIEVDPYYIHVNHDDGSIYVQLGTVVEKEIPACHAVEIRMECLDPSTILIRRISVGGLGMNDPATSEQEERALKVLGDFIYGVKTARPATFRDLCSMLVAEAGLKSSGIMNPELNPLAVTMG